MTFTVKVQHENDIRRFKMDDDTCSFDTLSNKISEVCKLSAENIVLKYKDDEGDMITMCTDDELLEAISMASGGILRLVVSPRVLPSAGQSRSTKSEETGLPAPSIESASINVPTAAAFATASSTAAASSTSSAETEKTDVADATAAAAAAAAAFEPFMKEAAEKLPEVMNNLQQAMPGFMESISQIFTGVDGEKKSEPPAVHWGVTCDRSGITPIVGTRYKKNGHNYDLCAVEFEKLSEQEKMEYQAIERPRTYQHPRCHSRARAQMPPSSDSQKQQPAVHWGITCDKSGQNPIVGPRFKMIGRDYDLNETEYNKLSVEERTQFERIEYPRCAWRNRAAPVWGPNPNGHQWNAQGPVNNSNEPSLQARFVRDVTIFDGTEVSPGTPFTKIWTVRNDGQNPWPKGIKLECVGGDELQAPHRVRLPVQGEVAIGSEVQANVDLVAPEQPGRYIAYFRLISPNGKRFGQRVWCSIHVVTPEAEDQETFFTTAASVSTKAPQAPEAAAPVEKEQVVSSSEKTTPKTVPEKESLSKANQLPNAVKHEPASTSEAVSQRKPITDEDAATAAPLVPLVPDAQPIMQDTAVGDAEQPLVQDDVVAAPPVQSEASDADADSDDPVIISAEDKVVAALEAMGFTDPELNAAVINRENGNLEACAGTLATLADWTKPLNDLLVMGFLDRNQNVELMLKHQGDIRLVVKDLVKA